ncbi:MAG: DNA processing protein [Comamonadaceae bacterium]|nr:MAG: DNA processing protein [Comamonadaceae bacterium]
MDRDELAAWLRLTLTPGVGNSSARKLLAAFGLPQAVFEQSASALAQVLSSPQVSALRSMPPELEALLATTWGDSGYPQALLNLEDPPLLLYLLGSAEFTPNSAEEPINQAQIAPNNIASHTIDPSRSLAVVGSRNPTPQGAANAQRFAKAMAQEGLTIVSGLALGVDGAAHAGALEGAETQASGLTVAVVGTGLDRVYPKAHRDLAHRIAKRGLLVSEYPLGTPPLMANFPKRNRLIAGLSNGTLVVEAALKSGSLITARLTSEQGKEVFAIPGSIHAAQSRGCHALIKQGAKLVESAQDILEELRWPLSLQTTSNSIASGALSTSATGVFDSNSLLLEALGFDPVGLDALQARCGLNTSDLQAQLMGLELDGLVARLPGGLFQRQAPA